MNEYHEALTVLNAQFGHDTALSLATESDGRPSVRVVNAYFKEDSFYVVTYLLSHKMQEIIRNPHCALCHNLFSARGIGDNLGNPLLPQNLSLREELRDIFRAFYDRHVNENDPNTCILKIRLTDAVVFTDTAKFAVDFASKTAEQFPFINDIIL